MGKEKNNMQNANYKALLQNLIYHCNEDRLENCQLIHRNYIYGRGGFNFDSYSKVIYLKHEDILILLDLFNLVDDIKFTKSGFGVFMNAPVQTNNTFKNNTFKSIESMKNFIAYHKYSFDDINYQLWYSEYI